MDSDNGGTEEPDGKHAVKLMKEFKLTKGGQAYGVVDFEDESLRFIVYLLVG